MKRGTAFATAVVGILTFAVVLTLGWSVGRGLAASTTIPHYYLSIDTPTMLGGTEVTGPAYVPSDFNLPANTNVTVTIVDFDGATALPAQYAKATGITGTLSIQALNSVHPNATGTTRTAMSLNPTTGVAHTFTILNLGLNVPVAPMSRETFTFHTGAAGTYTWRCMDPCGNAPDGWGSAMVTEGFMEGHVTFT